MPLLLAACDEKVRILPSDDPDASSLTPTLAMPSPRAAALREAGVATSSILDGSVDAGVSCGQSGLADCPLQAWMKLNAKPALAKEDALLLSEAFEKIAKLAPEGFPNWSSISRDGESAAKAGAVDAARSACRACHDQYRKKYKETLRDHALP